MNICNRIAILVTLCVSCISYAMDNDQLNQQLIETARNGNIYQVQKLLDTGAYVDTKDDSKMTPLHLAVFNECEAMVKLLLKHKASPNEIEECGDTPLHLSAINGHEAITKLLLKYGADINIQEPLFRRTPLDIAITQCHKNVEILLKNWPTHQRMVAFLMATHPKHGKNSPAKVLPSKIFEDIYTLLKHTITEEEKKATCNANKCNIM